MSEPMFKMLVSTKRHTHLSYICLSFQ